MNTNEFRTKLTSTKLKENISKQFGVTVNLEQYSREHLEDLRNKLRTRVFQQEGSAGINDLLTNETYQKDKAMLDLLNTKIKEMISEDIKKLRNRMVELSENKKGVRARIGHKKGKGTTGTIKGKGPLSAKDYDKDGKKETPKDEFFGSRAKAATKKGVNPFAKSNKKSAAKSKTTMKESQFSQNVKTVNESLAYLLREDEEGKAKAITAAGDIVNDFTTWMQRVGQYQTKTMIELADAIRADFGQEDSEQFKQSVGPALAATLEILTQQREAISNAVAVLAGEATAMEPMGMEPDMDPGMEPDMDPGMEPAMPDEMNSPGDEFAASDAGAGAGTPGRELRESRIARKLAESHSIMLTLSK